MNFNVLADDHHGQITACPNSLIILFFQTNWPHSKKKESVDFKCFA